MKKVLSVVIAVILAITLMTSTVCMTSPTESTDGGERIGAVCNDGTTSSATGRGACSHHGGVDYWLYE